MFIVKKGREKMPEEKEKNEDVDSALKEKLEKFKDFAGSYIEVSSEGVIVHSVGQNSLKNVERTLNRLMKTHKSFMLQKQKSKKFIPVGIG